MSSITYCYSNLTVQVALLVLRIQYHDRRSCDLIVLTTHYRIV